MTDKLGCESVIFKVSFVCAEVCGVGHLNTKRKGGRRAKEPIWLEVFFFKKILEQLLVF